MMKQSLSNLSIMSSDKNKSRFFYSDEELIKKFQEGNEDAFIELVNRYKNKLINFVFQMIGDLEQSEDIVQETMIKLYHKKHYYREIAKFSTWIYTIARNQTNTELRKKKRKQTLSLTKLGKNEKDYEIVATQPSIEDDIENKYLYKKIKSCINELPEHYKTVIILRDIQQLSYEEISEIVGVPLGTIKSRINRARLQVQAELQDLK